MIKKAFLKGYIFTEHVYKIVSPQYHTFDLIFCPYRHLTLCIVKQRGLTERIPFSQFSNFFVILQHHGHPFFDHIESGARFSFCNDILVFIECLGHQMRGDLVLLVIA